MTGCIRRERSYWTVCQCPDCVIDRSRKRKLQSMGHRRPISHETAWAVLADRFANNWTALAVASAVGLDDDYFSRHLARWRRGEECHIGRATAAAILTMGRPTRGQVGALPTMRRLRALAAIGYGLNTLAVEAGVNFSTLAAVRNRNERVGARVANAVADAYERLHMTPGDDPQALRLAREKGWCPPLAYDDIDDPNEQPVDWAHIPTDRATAVQDLAAQGENATQIARRLNLNRRALERWCLRHLPDLWAQLATREGDWNTSGNQSHQTMRGDAA